MKYTPIQTLVKVRSELLWLATLLSSVEIYYQGKGATADDCLEVKKVIVAMRVEIERILRRETADDRNRRNVRQAEDFALKAKVAKERLAAAGALKFVRDEPSHK